MATLTDEAVTTLDLAGISPREWARAHTGGTVWKGDACGCPDDRCAGSHHDAAAPCDCLAALIAERTTPAS